VVDVLDDEERMALVFKALADPTRRRLLDRLHADNGQTLTALGRDLAITRQGITQHIAVLEAAGLVSAVRRGREKLHYLNPVPLHDIHDRWIARFEVPELAALSGLKRGLEMTTMTKPAMVHVTYIRSTPDQVWAALTDPEATLAFWGHRNVSDWQVGGSWQHVRADGGVDIDGRIVEVDPPRKLVHAWAAPGKLGDADSESTVTFDIEPVAEGKAVRLVVTHENLPENEQAGTNEGWQMVLASLKSFLETGEPLTVWA
jgi:uncharacterized protein YndB with AHSA1/START domain/DNA-binding transcriptional ArsR family regulator